MPQNSIAACSDGIEKAKQALKRKGLSQQKLARYNGCNLSRSTIDNFFNGKAVSNESFVNICEVLELDFDEIAGIPQASKQVTEQSAPLRESCRETINIGELVRTARDKIGAYIEERCGTMRVLDMTHPIGLDDIYTNVNILEKITGRIRVASIEELSKNVSADDFDRFSLGAVSEKRVPGLEAVAKYSKLMILGKPGAGKTTFLKHLALLCMKGRFQENRIPLFITLKDFAEAPNQPNLFSYLNQIFIKRGVITKKKGGINPVEQLLEQGKLLVLLDGLDEVRETDSTRVLKQIQDFTIDYPVNQFVITCRIASREYTFQQFTEVEVADFNLEQIESFTEASP
jgi:predicted NACHT family NTPase